MLVYGKYECFVMQMLYVCVLCASCGTSQCCILHDLQFVNAGRGYLFEVVGPGLFATSPAFVRSSASHPVIPHGRLAQKG